MLSNGYQNALRKSTRLARGANSSLKTVVRDELSQMRWWEENDMRLVVALGGAVSATQSMCTVRQREMKGRSSVNGKAKGTRARCHFLVTDASKMRGHGGKRE